MGGARQEKGGASAPFAPPWLRPCQAIQLLHVLPLALHGVSVTKLRPCSGYQGNSTNSTHLSFYTILYRAYSLVNQTTPSAVLDVLHHQHTARGSGLVHETNRALYTWYLGNNLSLHWSPYIDSSTSDLEDDGSSSGWSVSSEYRKSINWYYYSVYIYLYNNYSLPQRYWLIQIMMFILHVIAWVVQILSYTCRTTLLLTVAIFYGG